MLIADRKSCQHLLVEQYNNSKARSLFARNRALVIESNVPLLGPHFT